MSGRLGMPLRVVCTLLICTAALARPIGSKLPERLWTPVGDELYRQEVGRKIVTDRPIVAVAAYNGRLYAGFEDGVYILDGESFVPAQGPKAAVVRLESMGGALWAITTDGLDRLDGSGWQQIAPGAFRDFCFHLGEIVVAEPRRLLRVVSDTLEPIPGSDGPRLTIERVQSYGQTLYVLGSGRLGLFDGARYNREPAEDWGTLPSKRTRDLRTLGSRLYIATDRGLGVMRGMALTHLKGSEGLCYEDTTCLTASGRDLWIGTTRGAIRMTEGEFHYFSGPRWLPHENVRAIAVDDTSAYVATDRGLAVIEYVPYTLQKKAAFYERHLEEWGQKRLGFTHKLERNGSTGGWVREVSDNDAGWSTHYLGAMCFKYAVTGDEEARREALNTFNTLKWMEDVTPIDGYPARSIWAVGETGNKARHGSGGLPAEWHRTPDNLWEWKGDTSSDETDAHYYAISLFHDLIAKGEEKARAKDHLARISRHIIDNGWTLRDVDGKPTRWARWDPEYLKAPYGYYARGLNGLEILAYIRTTMELSPDAKFEKAYEELQAMGYHNEVIRQKLVFPPDNIFHSDDRLAFYAYFPLLHYETDPILRSIYFRSLERSWEVERIEHNPWFNFMYGVLTGNDCEAAEAVRHLREWPLDMIDYSYTNSHRHDLATPDGYVPYCSGTKAISPRERGPMRWSDNLVGLDGGSGGGAVVDPSGWLETYWMGRYYGFIDAPATDNPERTTVKKRGLQLGAKPYDGPPRPE